MHYVKGALSVVVLLAMVVFAIQNLEVISVSFLGWSMSIPKFVVIAGTYALGMITGAWLFDFLKHIFATNRATASS